MSQSKAKKHRKHLERNGQLNPIIRRNTDPDFSMHVRKTPTLKDKRRKLEKRTDLYAMTY